MTAFDAIGLMRQKQREEHQRKLDEYLAKGGRITEVPPDVSKEGSNSWRDFVISLPRK